MNKKCIALYIIFMMVFLNGCSMTKNPSILETVSKDEIVIKWMIYGEKSKSSDSVISEFNEELKRYFPDTTIEFEIVPLQSYQEKWNMKMATNEELDIVWIGNDVLNYTEEVKKGELMALDYLISINGENIRNEIPEELWLKQRRDGKIYSVPILGPFYRKEYALVTSKSSMGNYGNENKIAQVNQDSKYTNALCYQVIEEYLSNLQEAKKLGSGVSCDTFGSIAQKGYEGIYGLDSPFVIKIFDSELKVYNKYELDSYREYFKTMFNWYQKGYIRADIEEVLDPEKENGTKTGNTIFLDEYGEDGVVLDQIPAEYETIMIPLQNYKYVAYESSRNVLAIPKTTTNPNRAMDIINLLNSEDGTKLVRLLCNGFEGRHYVKREGQQIDRVEGEDGTSIYSLSPYSIGNVFYNYENSKGEFEQLEQYNTNAMISPLTGFELDTRMIVIEMEKVDLIVEEYITSLERGTSNNWEETYNEMISKINEAGAQKIIYEMQKQINLFVETKDTITK